MRLRTGSSRSADHDLADLGEAFRIAQRERITAVAHDQMAAVETEAPPLALVGDLPFLAQRRQVPNQRASVLPGQLKQAAADSRQSLAKEIRWQSTPRSTTPLSGSTRRNDERP